MKLENNWRVKTLETLEKDYWPSAESESRLVKRVESLRKIPLNAFTAEDLRLMISLQFSLNYMIPLALEFLSKDLWAEGDFYEGDLLDSVLKINSVFWEENGDYWQQLNALIAKQAETVPFHSIEKAREGLAKWRLETRDKL